MRSPGCAMCAAADMVLKGFDLEPLFESRPFGDTLYSAGYREQAVRVIVIAVINALMIYSFIAERWNSAAAVGGQL